MVCVLGSGVEDGRVARLRRALQPDVAVVVDRRGGKDRRRGGRRRSAAADVEVERRRVRAAGGRRVADRRAPVVTIAPPEVPRRVQQVAEQAAFLARLELPRGLLEDHAAARATIRMQGGDPGAADELREAWSARASTFAWLSLGDRAGQRQAVAEAYRAALSRALETDPMGQPFRTLLFEELLAAVRRRPVREGARPRMSRVPAGGPAWAGDPELVALLRELPALEREAVLLRFVGGLSHADTASLLGLDRVDARAATDAGLGRLRGRETALLRS